MLSWSALFSALGSQGLDLGVFDPETGTLTFTVTIESAVNLFIGGAGFLVHLEGQGLGELVSVVVLL
jgi:hypothetical protein